MKYHFILYGLYMITKKLNQLLQKKKILDSYKPFSPVVKKNLLDWMRIELTYNSNAIEGNTLNKQETALVVNDWLSVPGKQIKELLEAKNHDAAIEYILLLSRKIKISQISQEHILAIHKIILSTIDDLHAWCYRHVPVRIAGSETILPNYVKVPKLMDDVESWIHLSKENPLIVACELHYKLVTIHPFVDWNWRTARILFNLVLLIAGYPLVPILTTQRRAYLSCLEKAQTWWEKDSYYDFMLSAIDASLDTYISTFQNRLPVYKKESVSLLKISQLARETWASVSTIRYWTSLWLLTVEKYLDNWYALYHPSMIGRISTIHRMQQDQRLSLSEIKRMLT